MIIQRIWPLANDRLEGLASYKWSSVTPVTLITSPRIQIQSRGSFQNNLFLLCSVLLRKLKIQDLPPGIRGQDLKPCSACVCTSSSGTDTRLNNPFGLLRKSLVKVFFLKKYGQGHDLHSEKDNDKGGISSRGVPLHHISWSVAFSPFSNY